MFQKLRIRLILINMLVILLLFIVLTAGTYIQAKNMMHRQMKDSMEMMLHEIVTGNLQAPPPVMEEKFPPFFYIITDNKGNPLYISPDRIIEPNKAISLKDTILKLGKGEGWITDGTKEYYFLAKNDWNESKRYLIFQDTSKEQEFLHTLLVVLTTVAGIGLVLSFLGSLFLTSHSIRPIQEMWEKQKTFISDASHELRTPITVIRANMDVVLENREDTVGNMEKWLSNISGEAEYMSTLIESMLILSRADSNQMVLKMDSFNPSDVIDDLRQMFTPVATKKNISLITVADNNCQIYGDRDKIKQLLSILLDNALKFTSNRGEIELKCFQKSNLCILSVKDNGIGIKQEDRKRIFDRFYQADNSRTGNGCGLGLSIAKWIVDSHRGTIEVSSMLGKGSEFIVSLPAQR